MSQHLVRVGALGHVGRFRAVDAVRYPRGARVVVRTARGLETGEVLADVEAAADGCDGELLRGVTVEDELLEARLQKNRDRAYDACAARLAERGLPALLVDVEHLLDGGTLYFYFLGEQTPELEALTRELAELYDANVQFRQFAAAVAAGCGPDCGTDAAAGCGTSCASCAAFGACATRVAR